MGYKALTCNTIVDLFVIITISSGTSLSVLLYSKDSSTSRGLGKDYSHSCSGLNKIIGILHDYYNRKYKYVSS